MAQYKVWFFDVADAKDTGAEHLDEQEYDASSPSMAAEFWSREVPDEDGMCCVMVQEEGSEQVRRYRVYRKTEVYVDAQEMK